ncbi:MAG: proteasome assembly chaperone family protein [Methanobacteriaceae archaeon]|nr:proteasome assembly chaperone family protein [Methanobacteriaceae archaeon]
MAKTIIKELEEINLENPILIEGLPGIGFVGQIVTDQIIKLLDAKKFAQLQSEHFPPQVLVKEDGLIEPMKNEFHYIKDLGENNQDVIILTGNSQSNSQIGQVEICNSLIEYFEKLNIKQLFTVGGLGTGEPVNKSKVYVAGNNKELIDSIIEKTGAHIRKDDGGIVGASGLLLALAQEKEINAACLMGETPGFYIDPIAAKEVLLTLFKILEFEIDLEDLDKQVESTLKTLANDPQFNPRGNMEPQLNKKNEDLNYIG